MLLLQADVAKISYTHMTTNLILQNPAYVESEMYLYYASFVSTAESLAATTAT
jgi:hypothetical protein